MATATSEFFDGLAARGLEPGFGRTTGSVRFDLTRDGTTEHFYTIEFKEGRILRAPPTQPIASSAPTPACSTTWPVAGPMPWPRCCGAGSRRTVTLSS